MLASSPDGECQGADQQEQEGLGGPSYGIHCTHCTPLLCNPLDAAGSEAATAGLTRSPARRGQVARGALTASWCN